LLFLPSIFTAAFPAPVLFVAICTCQRIIFFQVDNALWTNQSNSLFTADMQLTQCCLCHKLDKTKHCFGQQLSRISSIIFITRSKKSVAQLYASKTEPNKTHSLQVNNRLRKSAPSCCALRRCSNSILLRPGRGVEYWDQPICL